MTTVNCCDCGEEMSEGYCNDCCAKVNADLDRLRRMLGILTAVVVAEAEAASAPEFEEALVAAGLATWEKYDRDRHGDFECDPEPGDLVWVLTDEAVALRDLGRKTGGAA